MLNIEIREALLKAGKSATITHTAGVVRQQLRIGNNADPVVTLDLRRFSKDEDFIQFKATETNSTQRIVIL